MESEKETIAVVRDWFSHGRLLVSRLEPPYLSLCSEPERAHGVGFVLRKDSYAVFLRNGSLFLRVNGRELDLCQGHVESKYKRISILEFFCLVSLGKAVFKRSYLRKEVLREFLSDPTFDGFDEMAAYPLEWCHRLIGNELKIRDLIDRWAS